MQDPDSGHVNDAALSGAPRRRRWLVTVAGGVILLLGIAGFIGHIVRPDDSYWSEAYGPWGLVLSLGIDAVFIALGGYLLARGRRERPPGMSALSRVNAFATRTGEQSGTVALAEARRGGPTTSDKYQISRASSVNASASRADGGTSVPRS